MTTVLDSINTALHQALKHDDRAIILGEDILDPYGGAFKVTRGLSDAFPGRVITTPISEAGIVGLASGMALRGLHPVVEIMFGDFLTLAADQIINHAAKFRWMYSGGKTEEEEVRVPLVIRTPMGGRRGYGPTHSQTLEKHFLGVPGLRVLAPTAFGNPGELLLHAIQHENDPVLFIENKLLYLQPLLDKDSSVDFLILKGHQAKLSNQPYPTYLIKVQSAPEPILTLAAYGYMAELARQAVLQLAYEHEIFVELVVPTQLSPFEISPILESAERTGRLLAVEEGALSLGWSAEIVAQAAETLGARLSSAQRLGALNLPIPASRPLEEAVLPDIEDIILAAQSMVKGI